MKIDVFVISDYAFEAEGRLNILGTFTEIPAKTLPLVHEGFYVTVRLRFSRTEEGTHTVRLKMVDPDSRDFSQPVEQRFSIKFKDDAPSLCVQYVARFKDLKFNSFGNYRVDLAIDGLDAASLPVLVRKPAPGTGGAAASTV